MLSRSGFRCFAACLPFLLLDACGGKEPQAKANGNAAERPIPVTTRVVQPSAWNDTLQALGTAKARESVTLTAKVSEIVQDVHFESGQQVRAGQVLVTLKGDAAQAALVQAEATYAEADRLYRRQKELADQQLIARSQLDTQLALRDAAAARVRQARADIGDRSYYAALDRLNGRPYAALVCAGSDGSNAARQIARIATGWRLREIAPPLVVCTHAQTTEAILAPKVVPAAELARGEELGAAFATGLAMGAF